jgi:hypothetical protein
VTITHVLPEKNRHTRLAPRCSRRSTDRAIVLAASELARRLDILNHAHQQAPLMAEPSRYH